MGHGGTAGFREARLLVQEGVKKNCVAIRKLHDNKAADDFGLVAELLKHCPEEFMEMLLTLCNRVLFTGEVPQNWRNALFNMLPKTCRAKVAGDFRPIASVRLFYKTFAYMLLGR